VHRDAERESHSYRVAEIGQAVQNAAENLGAFPPVVCVVPVRMQEAWLLFEEDALRRAAGNPHGRQPLDLPHVRHVESLPDPKRILHDNLRAASGLSERRLKRFSVAVAASRVAEFIDDFSPLRALSAFRELENEVKALPF
jgi:hypothetical protein